jgi:hypothetical protein
MLGVRRASVTDALHILEGEGALRGGRGCIILRDRQKLEDLAGDAYGFPEAQYSRLIAPFGKMLAVPEVRRLTRSSEAPELLG